MALLNFSIASGNVALAEEIKEAKYYSILQHYTIYLD